MIVLIGCGDYWAGPDYSLLLFYLVPILQTSWLMGRLAGVLISLACSLAWLVSHELSNAAPLDPLRAAWNTAIRLSIFLIICHLISIQSSLRKSIEQEREQASTDFLTGILNARGFNTLIKEEHARAKRYAHPFSVAFIDLDDFKEINDRHGHAAGDKVLRLFAHALCQTLRATDRVGRLGGDEFAILMPETDKDSGFQVIQKIRGKCLKKLRREGYEVTASFGLATFVRPPDKAEDILFQADAVMYKAKKMGKDRIEQQI